MKIYELLKPLLPETEHEMFLGQIKEYYLYLRQDMDHSHAMLRTLWEVMTIVAKVHCDQIVHKMGFFEEASQLKDFFWKLSKILGCTPLIIPYFCQQASAFVGNIAFLPCLTFMFIVFFCISFEWTFNHKNIFKFWIIGMALYMISLTLMAATDPQQHLCLDLYLFSNGLIDAPWLAALSILSAMTFLCFLFYVTSWIICGGTVFLTTGLCLASSAFFTVAKNKLFN